MPGGITSALPVVFLSREQLFESVWATPTVRLAREFGISDVALAKLCRRCNIPLPPRGYWAKLAAGQSLLRPNLPAPRVGEDRPVVMRPVAKIPAVTLPPAGERLHPIAERVRRRLLNCKKDYRGLIFVSERGLPGVGVSPAAVGKATLAVGFKIEEETTLLSKPNGRQVRGRPGDCISLCGESGTVWRACAAGPRPERSRSNSPWVGCWLHYSSLRLPFTDMRPASADAFNSAIVLTAQS